MSSSEHAGASGLTNEQAIAQWSKYPEDELAALDPEGDFGKQHLVNPTIFRMLGDVRGKRVLDAGCGQGYLSRLLAERGALVTGVEPATALYGYALEKERERGQGITYIDADLCHLPDLGEPFDAVVASMVFMAIPDWRPALESCVGALRPGGLFVIGLVHPCFEEASASWAAHGCVEVREYLTEYEIRGPNGTDIHRPLSTYLNAVIDAGCRLREIAEPGLRSELALGRPEAAAAVHVPNYVIVAAEREA